jgi:hypothetical protein
MAGDWMLADVHLSNYPCLNTEASVYWHHDGVFVIFPITPGRYRVIADLPASPGEHPPAPTLQQVQEIIDRRGPPGLVAHDPVWLAGFRINGRKVADYRWGRTFLAGDAAHVHSPAGGQGMNTGMQDTFNLAWKLALVIQGSGSDALLDSYSPERSQVGEEVLKAADRLTATATMHKPLAQTLRNLAAHILLGLPPVQREMAETMTEISLGYPDSPLNGPSLPGRDAPRPGERVPPAPGQPPPGSGRTPQFALFTDPTATADLGRRFPALLDPTPRPAFQPDAIWLVRPDGYVACSSNDPEIIAAYLDGLQPKSASG